MSQLPKVPTVAEVMAGIKKAQSNIFKPVTKVGMRVTFDSLCKFDNLNNNLCIQESMCYHYLPLLGAKSYVELSLAMGASRAMGRLYTRFPDLLWFSCILIYFS